MSLDLRGVAGAALVTGSFGLAAVSSTAASAAPFPRHVELGPPETVLTHGRFGLTYFPDECLTVVRERPSYRALIAAGVSSYLLEGPGPGVFTSARKVLGKGGAGEFDNGYAGISGSWRGPGGELFAIYHAEDQEGMPRNAEAIPGFYCRVGLAISRDDGTTFEKRGPILSGQLPKVAGGRFDQGVGEPWALAEPGGKWLYCYYTSHEPIGRRGVTICMARCPIAEGARTDAWRKFFEGDFTEPGIGGRDTPIVTGNQENEAAMFPQVSHFASPPQFVMLFCLKARGEDGEPARSGIYAAFSDDGIVWPKERFLQVWKVPVLPKIGQRLAWHPTFVPDDVGDWCGWLYYGYSENWGHRPPHEPHHLMRRPLSFTMSRAPHQGANERAPALDP